jgi:hypothetical protein
MKARDLDKWFRNLDSYELASIFPSLYEEYMMSADPRDNINTFIKEARYDWKMMTKEEKMRIYNMFD